MIGFILAAGLGTRLQPITDFMPKALVPVGGKPLLERALGFLASNGIEKIGVNTHYMAEKLYAFREGSPHPFTLFHEKEAILGTGGGIANAAPLLKGAELFFVCNVDMVYQFDLREAVARFLKTGWIAGLLAEPVASRGTILYDRTTGLYTGTPLDTQPDPALAQGAFMGAAIYRREFLGQIDISDFSVVPVWKRSRGRGAQVGVIEMPGCFWRDIGTPAALAGIHFDLLNGAVALDVDSHLYIDRAAKRCFPLRSAGRLQNMIGPLAWVETADVGEGAHISRSLVLPGAKIEAGRVVNNLIVSPHCEVPIAQ